MTKCYGLLLRGSYQHHRNPHDAIGSAIGCPWARQVENIMKIGLFGTSNIHCESWQLWKSPIFHNWFLVPEARAARIYWGRSQHWLSHRHTVLEVVSSGAARVDTEGVKMCEGYFGHVLWEMWILAWLIQEHPRWNISQKDAREQSCNWYHHSWNPVGLSGNLILSCLTGHWKHSLGNIAMIGAAGLHREGSWWGTGLAGLTDHAWFLRHVLLATSWEDV